MSGEDPLLAPTPRGCRPERTAVRYDGAGRGAMDFRVDRAVELLSRTPATLRALLVGVSDAWARSDEGPETWSPVVTVGHMTFAEEVNWIPRARVILEHGESRAFEAFDRFAQFERYKSLSLEALLDTFAARRRESLAALAAMQLTPERLALRGTHPDLGAVTLGQLLATWTVHDMNHTGQIVQTLAKQYREAIGPFRRFLPIVDR
jgi:uncharacterized damage-inducible protein DinB